jgi:putative acetyltransferase
MVIRESAAADVEAIEALYPRAFPDEDLLPLVRELLEDSEVTVSLVSLMDEELAGHAIFTMCSVDGASARVALLGPLAVAPTRQRRGVGSALVRAGLQHLKDADVDLVCVLGDPAYYGRFGFAPETGVEPPYQLPAEWEGAWQSTRLSNLSECSGRLSVPRQWRRRALWAP